MSSTTRPSRRRTSRSRRADATHPDRDRVAENGAGDDLAFLDDAEETLLEGDGVVASSRARPTDPPAAGTLAS